MNTILGQHNFKLFSFTRYLSSNMNINLHKMQLFSKF